MLLTRIINQNFRDSSVGNAIVWVLGAGGNGCAASPHVA
jgi:hypothetical protein